MPKSISKSSSSKSFKPKVELMERLKRRTDFRATATGVRAPARAFVLQARSRGDHGAVRVGFTVSKQVGNAVERNRVRRRLREMVRLAPAAALRGGHDYVLVGRREALAAPFGEMMRELGTALQRIHSSEPGRRGGTSAAKAGTNNGRSLHEAGLPLPLKDTGKSPVTGSRKRTAKSTAKSPE